MSVPHDPPDQMNRNVPQMADPRRFPALDLLRVIAVSMTVLVHVPSISTRVWGIRSLVAGLPLGVDLFMVISGWLLGGQVIREALGGQMDVRRFYFKRWMRTLPPYYAMLLILRALPGTGLSEASMREFLTHFLFLQEYLDVQRYGVSWSLCVEEHFYLLLPWLVLGLLRVRSSVTFVAVAVVVSALEYALRSRQLHALGSNSLMTHLRSEGLFVGVAMAQLSLQFPRLWDRIAIPSLALAPLSTGLLVGAMCLATSTGDAYTWLPTIGTWLMVPGFVSCVHRRSPLARVNFIGLEYGGELTYALYLTHSVVGQALAVSAQLGTMSRKALLLVAMLASAMLLRHLVEVPFMRLRRAVLAKWTTRRSS